MSSDQYTALLNRAYSKPTTYTENDARLDLVNARQDYINARQAAVDAGDW